MTYFGSRKKNQYYLLAWMLSIVAVCLPATSSLAALPETIEKVKPAIVGIGTMQKTRRPPQKIVGTGFVVADGNYGITTAQVIEKEINTAKLE